MENIILNEILKNRGGNYVHALEVESTYDIENTISEIANEFKDYGIEAIKEFFNSIAIYYIGEDPEEEESVYNFNTDDYIDNNISL